MEIIGFANGIIKDLKDWENLVGTIFCTYKKPKKGKAKEIVRVIVSPLIPYRIICPKEHMKHVLGIICPQGNKSHFRKSKKVNLAMNMMQKAMGLDKLPKVWRKKNHPITETLKQLHVAFHPIGTKTDGTNSVGGEML